MCKLVFDQEKYTVETVTMEGQTLTYRAYEVLQPDFHA